MFEPAARATVWSKYAYPSDRAEFQKRSRPDESFVWCSIEMRKDVKVANLGVDLETGPWRTEADMTPGEGPGHAQISLWHPDFAPRTKRWREYRVKLDPFPNIGRDRLAEIDFYNLSGETIRSIVTVQAPWRRDRPYVALLSPFEKIGRIVLRSRAIQHARFKDVHLYPNP